MIIFRTDANKKIATGHMMRCLTIATECRRRGITVCFVLADQESERLLRNIYPDGDDFRIEVLGTDYDDTESEIESFSAILIDEEPACVLIDSYFVTASYLKEISQYARIFYLDDIASFDYPVDVIINYGVEANKIYPQEVMNAGQKEYLLGPEYAPLREQFKNLPYQVKENVTDILITTGGTDETNITEKILIALNTTLTGDITYHVIFGSLHPHHELLLSAGKPRMIVYENVSDMASLMQKCDLAISASGSTLYELCAVGVPTICFTIADNQISNAVGLSKHEAVVYAEDNDFAKHIGAVSADFALRRKLSANMRKILDAKGASRIVDALCKE
ncbi:MAG: UDP-2,4-diacetamido-2,4,6-trideoxy-beta-L-altropyranose hydrolase [Lachnospiraceae bacterium]|nr:UDP-2,4-diacetamido-2,4,6-trideoxy-beta-L-altropyranose hydrolase [Lachnospiraceae bacterium]